MAYRAMYEIEIRHDGLHKYRHIRGSDRDVVEQKARVQQAAWNEMWEKHLARQQVNEDKQAKKERAIHLTRKAQQKIHSLNKTLQYTLTVNDTIVWDVLKDSSHFQVPNPPKPELLAIPAEPKQTDLKYQPKLGFWDKIFLWWGEKKAANAELVFYKDYKEWEKQKNEIPKINERKIVQYKKQAQQWEMERQVFLKKQQETNSRIDQRKQEYMNKLPAAIVDYCDMVLANSEYPDDFPQEYELDYIPETKILLVDYSLPSMDCLPTIKEIRYVQSRDELQEIPLKEKEIEALYDDLLYQVTLRTIHELFEADVVEALDAIVFNGWVRSIDKSTGKEVNPCIMSIQASRKEFLEFNLGNIDPKACFKKLKGVGSSQLAGLAAVAPIMKMNREDTRFIPAYDVANRLNEGSNLATMDWQDFEHLIRELFEKEFSQNGSEVKITRASRDCGVDAVIFDSDPLRGGKIVIQAKRYNNAVGFAAVRELYGTVINEGANKGILVTTSDYGPDAYEFAKDKQLTLLNGSNLLSLLEKHGHKARIDLKEDIKASA